MVWQILNENNRYEVSDTGIVRRIDTKRTLNGCISSGYRSVKLTFENSRQQRFYVHRLVAEHFINNPDPKNKTFVNHKDGNKLNNCVNNLEWCNASYNIKDMYKRIGKYNNDTLIIKEYKKLKSCNKVAKLFNTTGENIRQVLIRNNIERVVEWK